jgi:hypothetical protein
MRRALVFAMLCLVLLAQHRGHVHPIEHLAQKAPDMFVASAHAAADCVECALLAGGFQSLAAAAVPSPSDVPPDCLVVRSYHSRAGEVPAWFQSRAPPVLL